MLKVGDKVRIKKNLVKDEYYGDDEGKEAIVKHELKRAYKLDIDKGKFNWTDNMLEQINQSDENTDEVSTNLVDIDQIKQFKKEDLEFGDIITLRNKEQYIYTGKGIARTYEDKKMSLECWKEDLKHESMRFLDIMVVRKYETRCICYKRKEEILDEKDKEYLTNFIKPFRARVKYIQKKRFSKGSKFCWLQIGYIEKTDIKIYSEYMMLPSFNENTMYKNMELNKEYTLEELGL